VAETGSIDDCCIFSLFAMRKTAGRAFNRSSNRQENAAENSLLSEIAAIIPRYRSIPFHGPDVR
ncbi:MAG TPA: hypothetical protein VH107_11555, partial [Lacipirellulaceae bacterium]|nr:hypothetical protein [Lacipirellulaceae bacterium]